MTINTKVATVFTMVLILAASVVLAIGIGKRRPSTPTPSVDTEITATSPVREDTHILDEADDGSVTAITPGDDPDSAASLRSNSDILGQPADVEPEP